MKKERKIIFECAVGSKLYGTNRPESDEDFMGVFLPSTEDLFGLQSCPTEWSMDKKISTGERNTVGDVDRKFYSVQKFLGLLAEGQSKQLEMLFAPKSLWVSSTPEWQEILKHRSMFVAQTSIEPFIGFAMAQSYKSVIKGENLNLLRKLIEELSPLQGSKTLGETLTDSLKQEVKLVTLDDGVEALELAGRKYQLSLKTKDFLAKIKKIEGMYGSRSEKAAQEGMDYKSLSHAYRLLFETETILKTGELVFPLPPDQVEFLKMVRAGKYEADYFTELQEKMTAIREIPNTLQKTVNRSKVNELCKELTYNHFYQQDSIISKLVRLLRLA